MTFKQRIFALLSIKSLITLGIVGVFLYLCVAGREIPSNLDTYAGLVIAFYFGTQAEKVFQDKTKADKVAKDLEDSNSEKGGTVI